MKIFLSTKGNLNDVSAKVMNFLKFVDGLPVKDKWVDELQDFMTELKNNEKVKEKEKEKVNYMTYQMKIAEERSEAKAEERRSGIKSLISTAKALAATPAQAVEQLMKNYPLTEDEAKAAVQANW